MQEVIHHVFRFLASAASIYSILIFIRIIITWFSTGNQSKPVLLLARITDPYLEWWRDKFNLRIGFLDFSPVLAIAALSVFQSILFRISATGRLSIGSIIASVLVSVWSIISFIIVICIILLVLRIIAYITNRDTYSNPFWRSIDSISQSLLYRTNRVIFGKKIPGYLKGIIVSTLALIGISIAGKYLIPLIANLLSRLPI